MRKTVLVLATVASSLALAACSKGEEAAPAATEEAATEAATDAATDAAADAATEAAK